MLYLVNPPEYDYFEVPDDINPAYIVGMIPCPQRPADTYTYDPVNNTWLPPVTSYIIDAVTGMYIDEQTPLTSLPVGSIAILVAPTDNRMQWNFVTETWEWTIYALKAIAYKLQVEKLKEDFTWDSRQVTPGCPAMKFNNYAAAVSEDPDDERTVYFKSDFNPTEDFVILTNAQILDLFDTYWGVVGRINNVFADVIEDIIDLIAVDGDDVIDAWDVYDTNYDDTRTKLPTLAELAQAIENYTTPAISDITGLQTALDSKSTFDGDYYSLSNRPTNISSFTNDSDYITATSLDSSLSIYAQASGVETLLNGKEDVGVAEAAKDYAVQRANHTGTQSVSTITGLADVATSGDYSDLSNIPTPFSGSYTDLTNKPIIGKAYVNTTAKTNSFYVMKSGTVSAGTVTLYFTDDGLSTGNALFTEVDGVDIKINDANAAYQTGWVWSNSNKTLTITCNKLGTANILTGLLGQVAANGAVVNVMVLGR